VLNAKEQAMNNRSRSPQPEPLPADLLIRHARRRSGRTRQEIAQRAGMRESVVGRYELGLRVPDWDQLQRIILACGFWLDVRIRELGSSRALQWLDGVDGGWQRPAGSRLSGTPGLELPSAVYLGHRLRLAREEVATLASCLEDVAESFKHAESCHYLRFSRLVIDLATPPLDQAIAMLEHELQMIRSSRRHLRGSPRRRRGLTVDTHLCKTLAERVAHARDHLAAAVTRLRAERLDEMAYAVAQQTCELVEIEQAFRICRPDMDATG
jgi:transcriptional regulator with XRE-family HTH domain